MNRGFDENRNSYWCHKRTPLPSEFELDDRHRAECVTVSSANGRPYSIDSSQPPDLTNP